MHTAADFSLQDQDGNWKNLSDYHGKWLVLYFYPKDNTPGCTTEACNFRDGRDTIKQLFNTEIVGVSTDGVESHKRFMSKHQLNFTLLSDPEHKVIAAYDSWQPKKFMGKQFMGTQRNTFIIDPAGLVVKEYRGVDPSTHAQQIIDDLRLLQSS